LAETVAPDTHRIHVDSDDSATVAAIGCSDYLTVCAPCIRDLLL